MGLSGFGLRGWEYAQGVSLGVKVSALVKLEGFGYASEGYFFCSALPCPCASCAGPLD